MMEKQSKICQAHTLLFGQVLKAGKHTPFSTFGFLGVIALRFTTTNFFRQNLEQTFKFFVG